MKENSPDFSQKDLADLQKSPGGRQLNEKLRAADPAVLEKAMEEARRGDYAAMRATLSPLLSKSED